MGDKPEKPSGAVDDCTEPIPDTASEVKKTRARFGKETYKKELGPGRKQGRWTNDARNRRVALGNILPLYKVVLGVGCEKIEGKEQWGVGLIHLDVQFRIVLGPGAKDQKAADAGATLGGIEGTLGHETKHGDVIGVAVDEALDVGGKWNGAPWHIRDILDEMQKKRFSSKKEAEAERKKWQPQLEDWLARVLRLAANLHSDKKGQIEPRDGSAEILDKDKNKVEDEIKLDDWIKELKDLEAEGYTSLVQQGQFGKYP